MAKWQSIGVRIEGRFMAERKTDELPADLPDKRVKKKKMPAKTSAVLLLLLAGGGVFCLCFLTVSVVGLFWAFGVFDKRSGATTTNGMRDQVVGKWEFPSSTIKGGKLLLDIRKDGKITITGITPTGTETTNGTWEVIAESNNRLTVRISDDRYRPRNWEIEVVSADEIRIDFVMGSKQFDPGKRR
jgi:hypothetical protein